MSPAVLTTGENYERQIACGGQFFPTTINIFNISKINSEVRGGRAPRIRSFREEIGESYFDYVAGLEDLGLIMDESHRYRASAGIRAINELKPVLGLELTATPFIETSRGPAPHGVTPGRLSYALRLPCAPGKYRANSAYTPRRLRERLFSTSSGFARLSRHMQEYTMRFQLSSSTCASLREASQWHRRGLLSSVRLIRVERQLQLRPLPFPHSYTPLFILMR